MFRLIIRANDFREGMQFIQEHGRGIPDRCVRIEGWWQFCYR